MAASGGFTERAAGTIQILHTEPVMCPEPGEEARPQRSTRQKCRYRLIRSPNFVRQVRSQSDDTSRDYILVTEARACLFYWECEFSAGNFLCASSLHSAAL